MDGAEEREAKLAVPIDFVMPNPAGLLAGATVVDHGDALLVAVYWDTDDLCLAEAGVGLRHRNGTWTFKGQSRRDGDAVVREELEVDGEPHRVPAQFGERLRAVVELSRLHPVARLHTTRRRLDVARGRESAEVVHDRVSVRDGDVEVARFEEVEVEHPSSSGALATELVSALTRLGATVDPTAKYVRALRALGHTPPMIDA